MTDNLMPTTPVKSKVIIVVLFLFFLGPVILAFALYYSGYNFAAKGTNSGTLVTPPITTANMELSDYKNKRVSLKQFSGKWVMMYFTPEHCEKMCIKNLYNMRQVRKAMGRDQDRIDRVLVSGTRQQASALKALLAKDYLGTVLVFANKHQQQPFYRAIPKKSQHKLAKGELYIMDPLGNIMMTYAAKASPEGMLKDLKRLLKVSQIG